MKKSKKNKVRHMDKKELYKEIGSINIKVIFIMIILLILIVSNILIVNFLIPESIYIDYNDYVSYDFDVNYTNLTENEIRIVNGWLNDLEIPYAMMTKNIKFTNNLRELNSNSSYENGAVIGMNKGGNIIVWYTGNARDKEVLCHEIWHSIINLNDDIEEWFVDDIDHYISCYKDGK